MRVPRLRPGTLAICCSRPLQRQGARCGSRQGSARWTGHTRRTGGGQQREGKDVPDADRGSRAQAVGGPKLRYHVEARHVGGHGMREDPFTTHRRAASVQHFEPAAATDPRRLTCHASNPVP